MSKKGEEGMYQAYLRVNGESAPQLVFKPKECKKVDANMIKLEGVTLSMDRVFDEDMAMEVCARISEACRKATQEFHATAACEHLSYAVSAIEDILQDMGGCQILGSRSTEILLRGVVDRINWAGRAIGVCPDDGGGE